ncbi:MAG: hypothetical protein JSR60_20220 [Proteobacteria bacterium]|nr:hypothetical protein [Pseudomonadota bacterium]
MPIPVAALMFAANMAAQPMAMDQPVAVGGMETVCTGIGEAKDDPRWKSYPIRIEFSNGGAQYLSGAHVTVDHGDAQVVDVNCPGAWLLLKGQPGSYKVMATINGSMAKPVTAPFEMGHGAQKRIVLRFPDFEANE